jgi:hypothetical protein
MEPQNQPVLVTITTQRQKWKKMVPQKQGKQGIS